MLTLETMKTLYFDCFSGISGDMTIGALLDLRLDLEYLKAELRKLPVEGYERKASRVPRWHLSAMKFDVVMEDDPGHEHSHEQQHSHGHDHHHDHGHDHEHQHDEEWHEYDHMQHRRKHHGHCHFHRKASEI